MPPDRRSVGLSGVRRPRVSCRTRFRFLQRFLDGGARRPAFMWNSGARVGGFRGRGVSDRLGDKRRLGG
jgi:hypothetical protein